MDNTTKIDLTIEGKKRQFEINAREISVIDEHNTTISTVRVEFIDLETKKLKFLNVDMYHDGITFTLV